MATVLPFPYNETETDDRMGLNESDSKWLRSQIQTVVATAVEEAVGAAVDTFRPHGFHRVTHIVREYGLAAVIVTVPLALLGTTLTGAYYALSRVGKEAAFEQKTEDRLDGIQARLNEVQATREPAKVLKELTTLQPPQLARNLPALQTISEQPVTAIHSSLSSLPVVATKLADVDNRTPDYWPTVLHFIQFASRGLSPGAPVPDTPGLKVMPIRNLDIPTVGNQPSLIIAVAVRLEGRDVGNVKFVNDLIIFTDKPISFHGITFINYNFQFPSDVANPPQYLKDASQQLLRAGIEKASISVSAGM